MSETLSEGLVVDLAVVKGALRVTHTEEDSLLALYVKMATELIEIKIGRPVVTAGNTVELAGFPAESAPIVFSEFGVVSVESVTYLDALEEEQVWSAENYSLVRTISQSSIVPGEEVVYPNATAVTITLSSVPFGLLYAVIALTSHFFLNRSPVMIGSLTAVEIPKTLAYALDAYKEWKV